MSHKKMVDIEGAKLKCILAGMGGEVQIDI